MKLKFAKAKGFTLMEVLVVVLILAILATIALPTYYKAVLKSRAAEAINLLMMVRSKQAVNFSRDQRFFTGFDQIPGGKLTLGQEAYSQNSPNLLVIGDGHYEVELQPENQCAVSRYIENGEQKFEFSISYLRNGLGCTGEICDGFPDVIALADDFCTAPIPPIPPAGCPDPNFNPNSCIYPKILSADGCGCQCPAGIEQSCSSFQTFNDQTCKCECDQTKVPTPANQENYDFSPETCWTCKLTAETCAAQNKLFDQEACACVCRMVNGECCCPNEDEVDIGGVCRKCNGTHYVSAGVGYCCEQPTPYFNAFTHLCEACPVDSRWDDSLKDCLCETGLVWNANRTACVCDTAHGWQAVTGVAANTHGCCQDSNVVTLNFTGGSKKTCCEQEAYTFGGSMRYSASNVGCCPADRPFVHVNHNSGWTDPGAVMMCRKCQNETDTMVNGICQPCPAGQAAFYNATLGYAECQGCDEHMVISSNGNGCVCDTANGWQAVSGVDADAHGCCQDSNVVTLNFTGGSKKTCCANEAYTYGGSSRYSASYAGCCPADRPFVHIAHNSGWSDPGANVMCRKCQNATDTMVEGVCQPCPAGQAAFYNPNLGYAECQGCDEHQVINSNGDGCACDTTHGWQAVTGAAADTNGCCQTSNVVTVNVTGGSKQICCTHEAYTFGGSSAYSASNIACCSDDRPFVHVNHNSGWTNPGANVMCRRCQNATDTVVNGNCQPCTNGQAAIYNPNLGYAECQGCDPHQVLNSDGSGCVCDTANGWQAVSGVDADAHGCCQDSNVVTLNFTGGSKKTCCANEAYTYGGSSRYSASYAGCCPADRPFVHIAHNSGWSDPGANVMCRKCQNETDTMIEGVCQPCPAGQAAIYNPNLGYAECQGCPEHMAISSNGNGCVCDTAHGWQAVAGAAADTNNCCHNSNVRTLNFSGGSLQACCEYEAYTFGGSHRYSASNKGCCSAERQFVNTDHNSSWADPGANVMCRKCQNATDTILNGICMSCDAAYPGQNRVPQYNAYDGYAHCICPSNTMADSNGVCKTCAQLYGSGYTYTSGTGMEGTPHCCHPYYSVNTSTTNGCSQCPIGSHYANNVGCEGCICDSSTGHTGYYGLTDRCTKDQCTGLRIFATNTCQCACPVVDGGSTHLTWSETLGCCHCQAKEIPFGQEGYDPRFNPNGNGCYIGETI